MLTTTALYAGILALLLVALSARVILYRNRKQIGLGDAGDQIGAVGLQAEPTAAVAVATGLHLAQLRQAAVADARHAAVTRRRYCSSS